MSKTSKQRGRRYAYTQNRELSWLRFNRRILEEADDKNNPVLERLKFISIFSANLDEFFMVRVGRLLEQSVSSPHKRESKTAMTSKEQLSEIYSFVVKLIKFKERVYASVYKDLFSMGIKDFSFEKLDFNAQRYISKYFKRCILPVLSPMIIGPRHPAQLLVNKGLYVSALLKDTDGKYSLGLIRLPDSLPRYVKIENTDLSYVRTENIVLHCAPGLFGAYAAEETCIIRVTKSADIRLERDKSGNEGEDFMRCVMKLLKNRERMPLVRLEIDRKISDTFKKMILKTVNVGKRQIYTDSTPLDMKYVYLMIDDISPHRSAGMLYEPHFPRWPEDIRRNMSITEQIKRGDKILFYPFDSVEPFIKLLGEAGERDDVVSIKITVYRLAASSEIVRALCRAAERGKEVIVLMELCARFDEANNICWSKMLEQAGCHVIYGIKKYKCHGKICLITMRGENKISYITQIGTGNYNEKTNKIYTDLCFMTSSQRIGEDAALFFRNMLVNNPKGEYKELAVSPNGIKKTVCELIERESEKGKDGYICIKANSISERDVIDKLMQASCKGVKIQLIIRGICCILPSVPSYTENISVTSIVGRYLEHARIYCFGRGDMAKLYISSADLMGRNLKRRVEIACPIYDRNIRAYLMQILSKQLSDTAKASLMMPSGKYVRKHDGGRGYDSQMDFEKMSFHKDLNCEDSTAEFIKSKLVNFQEILSERKAKER